MCFLISIILLFYIGIILIILVYKLRPKQNKKGALNHDFHKTLYYQTKTENKLTNTTTNRNS